MRGSSEFLMSFLNAKTPLRTLAAERGCGKDHMQVRVRRSLEQYVRRHGRDWLTLVRGRRPLITVCDAIWYHVDRAYYTIYVILLRPLTSSEAIICLPIVLRGREDLAGWQRAYAAIPDIVKPRITAMVCDGATSLVALAREQRWVLQRCHFHLIAAVQNYLTSGPRSKHRAYALGVLAVVQKLLATDAPPALRRLKAELRAIHDQSASRGLRRVLRGLLRDLPDYHAYLRYPELRLPTTSNAAESCIQCFRDLMYRCRGFRSYDTLVRWLTAAACFKQTICCNGKHQPK